MTILVYYSEYCCIRNLCPCTSCRWNCDKWRYRLCKCQSRSNKIADRAIFGNACGDTLCTIDGKAVNDILDTLGYQAQESRQDRRDKHAGMELEELRDLLAQMEQAMLDAAKNLEFETAAALRDEMLSVKRQLNRKLDGLPIADQMALAEEMDKIKVGVGTGRGPLKVEPKSPPKPGEPGARRATSRTPRRSRR